MRQRRTPRESYGFRRVRQRRTNPFRLQVDPCQQRADRDAIREIDSTRFDGVDCDRQNVERKHSTTALGEGSRDCAADSSRGAGDDDGAIVEANLHG